MSVSLDEFWEKIEYINSNVDKIFDYDTDNNHQFLGYFRNYYRQRGDRLPKDKANIIFSKANSDVDLIKVLRINDIIRFLNKIDKLYLTKDDIEEISFVLADVGYEVKYNVYYHESTNDESYMYIGKPIIVLNVKSEVEDRHLLDLIKYLDSRDLEIIFKHIVGRGTKYCNTQYRITYKKYINIKYQKEMFDENSDYIPMLNESSVKINSVLISSFREIKQLEELNSYIKKANQLNIFKKVDNIGNIINLHHVSSIYDVNKREFIMNKSVSNWKIPRLISGLKYMIESVKDIKEPKLSSEEFKYLIQPIIDDLELEEGKYLTKVWLGTNSVFYILETTIFSKKIELSNDIINYLFSNGIELIDSLQSNQLFFKDIDNLNESKIPKSLTKYNINRDIYNNLLDKLPDLINDANKIEVFKYIDNMSSVLNSFSLLDFGCPKNCIYDLKERKFTFSKEEFDMGIFLDIKFPKVSRNNGIYEQENSINQIKTMINRLEKLIETFKDIKLPSKSKEEFKYLMQPIIDDLDLNDNYSIRYAYFGYGRINYLLLTRLYDKDLEVSKDILDMLKNNNIGLELKTSQGCLYFKDIESINESYGKYKYDLINDIIDELNEYRGLYKQFDNIVAIIQKRRLIRDIYNMNDRMFTEIPKYKEFNEQTLTDTLEKLESLLQLFKSLEHPKYSKEEMMDILTPILDDLENLYPKTNARGMFALNDKPEIKLYLQDDGYLYRLEYLASKNSTNYDMDKNIYNYIESFRLKLKFEEIIPAGPISKKLLRFDITEVKNINESISNKNEDLREVVKNKIDILNNNPKLKYIGNIKEIAGKWSLESIMDYTNGSFSFEKLNNSFFGYDMKKYKSHDIYVNSKLTELENNINRLIDVIGNVKIPRLSIEEFTYIMQPLIDDLDLKESEYYSYYYFDTKIIHYCFRTKLYDREIKPSNDIIKYLNNNGLELSYHIMSGVLYLRDTNNINESVESKVYLYPEELELIEKLEELNNYSYIFGKISNFEQLIKYNDLKCKNGFIMAKEIKSIASYNIININRSIESVNKFIDFFNFFGDPKYTIAEFEEEIQPIIDDLGLDKYTISLLMMFDRGYRYKLLFHSNEGIVIKDDVKYYLSERNIQYEVRNEFSIKSIIFSIPIDKSINNKNANSTGLDESLNNPNSRYFISPDLKNVNSLMKEEELSKEKTMSDLKEKYLEINKYRDIFPLISNLGVILRTYEISFILNKNFDILTNKSYRQIKRLYDRVDALINFFEKYGRPKYTKEEFEEIIQPIIDDLDSNSYVCEIYMIFDDGYTYMVKFEQKTYDKIEVSDDIKSFLNNYGISFHISNNDDSRIKNIMFKVDESNNESLVNKKSLNQLKKVKTKNISLKKFANLLSDDNLLDKHIQTYEEFLKTKV